MENLFNSQDIIDINIEDSVKASYLDYSMSVIIGRALPDARDGLKPVHRRILFAMHDLNMTARAPYKNRQELSEMLLVSTIHMEILRFMMH